MPIVFLLFPGVVLGMLAYNLMHQGCLGWDYRWHSRAEAPVLFWYTVVMMSGALLFAGWVAIREFGFWA